jgi:hypothetical protein
MKQKKGGKCLDTVYINKRTDMNWECQRGHQFKCPVGPIRNNDRWCKQCADHDKRLDISESYILAMKKGGKCISDTYVNSLTNMSWICKEGHMFESTLSNIKRGTWCLNCRLIEIRINSLKNIENWLYTFNGKLLINKDEINFELKVEEIELEFECEHNHIWKKMIDKINFDIGCPKCTLIKKRTKAIDKLEEWIKTLKGNLVSNKEDIINSRKKFNEIIIKVECNKKHIWCHTIEAFRKKTWCPKCKFKSESACRDIFEELFQTPFIKRRLECMEYLELDGFCEKYRIAFEYNGLQHEQYIEHFHRNGIQDFFRQQERDRVKNELCKKNDIVLINIPSRYTYTDLKKLKEFIVEELENNGIIVL